MTLTTSVCPVQLKKSFSNKILGVNRQGLGFISENYFALNCDAGLKWKQNNFTKVQHVLKKQNHVTHLTTGQMCKTQCQK
jgi:hypothetical protein